ncbi:hypothetical protein [Bacillus toyonensis]|uniref:Group-specific protein n=1 Tax=Bacillus toyonensis TaxID=155322 RepID=A0A2A8H7H7_9BACI|nr:hypothetical protein [Bacillus toyonensis]PEP89740.1 hypothetical protein CN585_28475 [Bacillus toyonensis]
MFKEIIIAILSIAIWVMVSLEFIKSSKKEDKENNGRKIVTLMSAGILLTLLLIISLYQNIQL